MDATPGVEHRSTARWAAAGVAAALAAGVGFRLFTRSELWLDEALSVNIASLPFGDMLEALRHDGHPPLYYALLHLWMEVFGDGAVAARSLSGVFALITLPLCWVAARRYGEAVDRRAVAAAAVVLLATSPFAVRYATEARMYSLVSLLVLTGWIALRGALARPIFRRLAAVSVVAGLLALTHYWSFYLLAATGLVLVVRWRRGHPTAGRALAAVVAGGVLFLPWLPSFFEQAGSTGTPWGRPERPTNLLAIMFTDFGGGPNGEAQLLGVGLSLLIGLALFGRALDRDRLEIDLRTRRDAWPEAIVAGLTLALSVVAGYATASAFASRYTAVIFPLVVLLAALGMARVANGRLQALLLAGIAALGIVGCVRNMVTDRTQAGELADYIVANGASGDVVAFCPDQLGPAVHRLVPDDRQGVTFPDLGDPRFVNWVDYKSRMEEASAASFAVDVDDLAGRATVWLVWSSEYRTVEDRCNEVVNQLKILRPGGTAVVESGDEFEHAWLFQYGPAPG